MAERGEGRVERRLAAVLAADVVGYSRLAGLDEEGTVAGLKAHRRELIEPAIAEHRGRLVKTTGDGLLAVFDSVVDALRCAIDVQRGMTDRNASAPPDRRIEFRIGLNSGDLIVDGDDVLGDGVNVAARLETLAEPGGICVSARVREDAAGKVDVAFDDAGEQALRNIVRPVRVFHVRAGGDPRATLPTAPTLPDKPSIAVLPFQNMSGDPEQEYFADGMAEEIITALSRMRWLFVMARASSFTYKGRAVDVKRVGVELGVRYVLEGSVRKSGSRVRITAQLVDATGGAHLWADRFDGALDDVFELQDRVTESVVGAIAPSVERAEIDRARRKPTGNLDAYDLYLRALGKLEQTTRASVDEALEHLRRAMTLDPGFAAAHALASRCLNLQFINGWASDRETHVAETRRVARRAIELGRDDPAVLAYAGFSLGRVVGEIEESLELIERALQLDPYLAIGWQFSGALKAFAGESEEAIARLSRAMQLNPRDPRQHMTMAAISWAHFAAGRYDEAVAWGARSLRAGHFVPSYAHMIASLTLAGRIDEARHILAQLREVEPDFRIATVRETTTLRRPADRERYLDGLRRAGVPE